MSHIIVLAIMIINFINTPWSGNIGLVIFVGLGTDIASITFVVNSYWRKMGKRESSGPGR
jgi:preprotein translocase subunit SecF